MAIEAKIKAVFQDQLRADGNFYHYPNSPKLSDSELLAISIQAESEGINSENHLFTVLKGRLPGFLDGRISRPRFNIRKRKLNLFMEDFFLKAHGLILPSSTHFVVDSTPLPV